MRREERYYGELFTLAKKDDSAAGDSELVSTFRWSPRMSRALTGYPITSRQYVAVQIVGSGLKDARVSYWIDGDYQGSFSSDGLDHVDWIDTLLSHGSHNVTLRISESPPPASRLGVVWRTFSGTAP